jgi:hypothetical protein
MKFFSKEKSFKDLIQDYNNSNKNMVHKEPNIKSKLEIMSKCLKRSR